MCQNVKQIWNNRFYWRATGHRAFKDDNCCATKGFCVTDILLLCVRYWGGLFYLDFFFLSCRARQIHCGWFLSCLQYWYCHSFNCLKDMLDVFSSTFWEMFHIASIIVLLFYSFSTRKIYQQKNVKIVIWNKCMQLFHEWQRQIIGPLDYVILKKAFNHSVWTL